MVQYTHNGFSDQSDQAWIIDERERESTNPVCKFWAIGSQTLQCKLKYCSGPFTHIISKCLLKRYYILEMPGKSEDILGGFRVNWMNLRDADTGKILWQVINYCLVDKKEWKVNRYLIIPGQRWPFSSGGWAWGKGAKEDFEMQSSVKGNQFHLGGTHGKVQTGTEGSFQWNFNFGFVIPKSTNP